MIKFIALMIYGLGICFIMLPLLLIFTSIIGFPLGVLSSFIFSILITTLFLLAMNGMKKWNYKRKQRKYQQLMEQEI